MDWERLATKVRNRRNELGWSQDEAVAAAGGGISKPVWSIIENARQDSYKERTLAALCRALRWRFESVDLILAGGEPVEFSDDHLDRQVKMLEDLRDVGLSSVPDRILASLATAEPDANNSLVEVARLEQGRRVLTDDVSQLRADVAELKRRLQQLGRVVREELQVEYDVLGDEIENPTQPEHDDDEAGPTVEGPPP